MRCDIRLTTVGAVYVTSTVDVGSTNLQEHAFARPDTAIARPEFSGGDPASLVVVAFGSTPLTKTELKTSAAAAIATALTALAASAGDADGATVVVAVCVTVSVVTTRIVSVATVVDAAGVVIVLMMISEEPDTKRNGLTQ
jgi:hypothetical protein